MLDETVLEQLLSRWERASADGHELSALELCQDRPDLAPTLQRRMQAVRQMNQLAGAAPSISNTPTLAPDATGAPVGAEPRNWPEIPGYQVLGELGRGGMGVVYKARHLALKRIVALKMILAGSHAGEQDLARFRAEAEASARLHHPHIVQIYEVGECQGSPFFSLEFAEAGSLADKLHGTPLPARQAAELVETLAHAIHAAHEAGIVHRDLKPANILLAYVGSPTPTEDWQATTTPKITDFGLAKQLGSEHGQTQSGAIMGTPSYMAPEQAGGKSAEIGPAADVYALGAILYELLTGRPPFRAATPLDTVMLVVSEEPVPPRRLQPSLPRDLETICLKCLHKDRTKRYASAQALAADLHRFGAGEPIQARPTAAWERTLKWAKRRPAWAAFAIVSAAAVAGLLGGALWYNSLLAEERDTANAAKTDAERQRDIAKNALEETERQRDIAKTALEETERQREQTRLAKEEAIRQSVFKAVAKRTSYGTQVNLTQRSWDKGQMGSVRELLQGLRPRAADDKDLRGFEWYYLDRLAQSEVFTFRGHEGICYEAAFSADGQRVASVGLGGRDATGKLVEPARVQVWEPATGRELFACAGHIADLTCVAFSPSGEVLASGGGLMAPPFSRGEVKLWNADDGKPLGELKGMTQAPMAVVFDPAGKRLAAAGLDPIIRIWEIGTGKELRQLKGHRDMVRRLAFSPDGKRLASASLDKSVRIWDVEEGKLIHSLPGHIDKAMTVAFHPSGEFLVSAGFDKVIRIWDVASGKQLRTIGGHTGFIATVVFSPDGKRLASAGGDKTVRLWDFASGQPVGEFRGRDNGVNTVAFSRDGRFLVAASSDGAVTVWETQDQQNALRTVPGGNCLAFGGNGKFFAVGREDGKVMLWDGPLDREVRTLVGHTKLVNAVAFSRDGRWLASASDDKTIRLWELPAGQTQHVLLGHEGTVESVAFSPDGRWLVSGAMDKTVRVWDVAEGRQVHNMSRSTNHHYVAFSGDGKLAASCGIQETQIALWDPATGQLVGTLAGHGGSILSVAFSPDGSLLASGSLDGTVKVWDVATRRNTLDLRGLGGQIGGVAFSPDGQRLAAATGRLNSGEKCSLQVWDVVTGQLLLELPAHGDLLTQLAFSPDGRALAGASTDGAVLVWEGSRAALPDTSTWKVLFADNFQRQELGDRWSASEAWSLKEGRLCGRLEKAEYQKLTVAHAGATPLVELPATVEVRFDCWMSANMNVMAMFAHPGNKSVTAWLLAVPEHMAMRGAAIVWQGGVFHFPILTANPHLEVKAQTRYRVRILREPRRLTLFVDDVEVASAAVPLLQAEGLRLGGMFGELGEEICFGNVEIRAPQ